MKEHTFNISLSDSFYNKEGGAWQSFKLCKRTLEQIHNHVTSGKAMAVGIYTKSDKYSYHRISDYCLGVGFLGLDFDDNGIKDIQTMPLFEYAFSVYSTDSSGNNKNGNNPDCKLKCRVLWALPRPLNNEDFKYAIKALHSLTNVKIDENCKDSARIFFGSDNTIEKPIFRNVVLPEIELKKLIELGKSLDQQANSFLGVSRDNTDEYKSVRPIRKHIPTGNDITPLELLYVSNGHEYNMRDIENSLVGERHNNLFRFSCASFGLAMASNALHENDVYHDCIHAGLDSGLPEHEVITTVNDAKKRATIRALPDFEKIAKYNPDKAHKIATDEIINTPNIIGCIDLDKPSIAIKSPMATFKTTLLRTEIIDKTSIDEKILYISHRRALSKKSANDLDLDNYESLDIGNRRRSNRLAVVLNSLLTTQPLDENGNPYIPTIDKLALDECSQLLAHLIGGTFTDKKRDPDTQKKDNVPTITGISTKAFFDEIVKKAKQVIIMDAFLDQHTIDYFKALRPDLYVYDNQYVQEQREIIFYTSHVTMQDDFINDAKQHIAMGKRVAFMGGLNATKRIRVRAQQEGFKNILVINSENSNDETIQNSLLRLGQLINDRHLLVLSPTVGSGVSIKSDDPIDILYCEFNGLDMPASELFQMLGRFRGCKNVKVFLKRDNGYFETNPNVIYKVGIEQARNTNTLLYDYGRGKCEINKQQDNYHKLYSVIHAHRNYCKHWLFDDFKYLAKSQGYTFGYNNRLPSDNQKEAYKEVKQATKEETKQNILNADTLHDSEYKALKDTNYNSNGFYALERHRIERCIGDIGGITSKIYDMFDTPKKKGAFYTRIDFGKMLNDPDDAIEKDYNEATFSLDGKKHNTRRLKAIKALYDALPEKFVIDDNIEQIVNNWLYDYEYDFYINTKTRKDQTTIGIIRQVMGSIAIQAKSKRIRDENDKQVRQYTLQDFESVQFIPAHLEYIRDLDRIIW